MYLFDHLGGRWKESTKVVFGRKGVTGGLVGVGDHYRRPTRLLRTLVPGHLAIDYEMQSLSLAWWGRF